MFDSYIRIKEDSKKTKEDHYFFNMSRDEIFGWSIKKRSNIIDYTTENLAEYILTELYNFSKLHKSNR